MRGAARRAIAAALLAALAGAPVGAQPGTTDRAASIDAQIDQLRGALRAGKASATSGEASLELSEALLRRLWIDGADSAALVGVLTPEQRERVSKLSREAVEAARAAGAALDAAVARLETDPEFPDRRDMQDERSRLAVELREMRLPLALGRALLLAAATEADAAARASLAQRAAEAVGATTYDDPAVEGERLVILAMSRVVQGPAASRGALELFDAVLAGGAGSQVLARAPRTWAEAMLGKATLALFGGRPDAARVLARSAMTRPPFVTNGAPNALLQALAADALFRAGFAEAMNAPTADVRRRALAAAYDVYAEFLERDDIGAPFDSRRAIVFAKLAGCPTPPGEPETWPALAAVGRAQALPPREAAALLRRVASRPRDELGAVRPLCMWELALTLERMGDDAAPEAMSALVALATQDPEWRGAAEAVDRACRIGERLAIGAAATGAGSGGAPWREAYIAALRLATTRADVEAIDHWRLRLGEEVPGEEGDAALRSVRPSATADYAAARWVLAQRLGRRLTSAAPEQRAALASDVLDAVEEARRAGGGGATGAGAWLAREEVDALATLGRLQQAVEAAERAAKEHADASGLGAAAQATGAALRDALLADDEGGAKTLAALALRCDPGLAGEGLALLALGRPAEAVALFDRASAQGAGDAWTRLGRAEALRAAGDAPGAFAAWRDLGAALEPAVRSDPNAARLYWRCWRRMLETLEANNPDGARTAAMRREIVRLRAIDPAFGGGVDGAHIAALAGRVAAP